MQLSAVLPKVKIEKIRRNKRKNISLLLIPSLRPQKTKVLPDLVCSFRDEDGCFLLNKQSLRVVVLLSPLSVRRSTHMYTYHGNRQSFLAFNTRHIFLFHLFNRISLIFSLHFKKAPTQGNIIIFNQGRRTMAFSLKVKPLQLTALSSDCKWRRTGNRPWVKKRKGGKERKGGKRK